MSSRITVLCVDDHPLMRDGIVFAIQQQEDMEVIAEAASGIEAVLAYQRYKPDITLMDIRMAEMNGMVAMAEILKEFPLARIIIVTTYADDAQAIRAMEAGAMGYLLKSDLRTDLIKTIRQVHAVRMPGS